MAAPRPVRWLASLVIIIILLGIGILVFVYSGVYNVAADYPDSAPVRWVLSNTADHSVQRHARGIKTPDLAGAAMIRSGAKHYSEECQGCHGAPGAPAEKVVRAFNPDPPRLMRTADDWRPRELFWFAKHGVRMTAMPAWGKVEDDDELWQITAFMRKMSSMSPAEYKSLKGSGPGGAQRPDAG